jgi:hypothetical protein
MSDVELDAVTLTQIVDALAIDRTPVEKQILPCVVFDKTKPFVDS